MSAFIVEFLIASVVFIALDGILALLSFRKGDLRGKYLGLTCIGCASVGLSYMVSCLCSDIFVFSCVTSLYFLSMDFMLFCLVLFVMEFCRVKKSSIGSTHLKVALGYLIFEVVIFVLNPFLNFVISFVPRDTPIAKFSYDMHVLFYAHLVFCYTMVGTVLFYLIYKLVRVPMEYKRQYIYALIGLSAIVAVNAVFLFSPDLARFSYLDISIFGYSIGAYIYYWACFNYTTKGMMNLFKMSVFENLDQGLVLFDNSGKLILFNEMANRQWPNLKLHRDMDIEEFKTLCKIDIDPNLDNCVLQCYEENEGEQISLRCDFRTLKNNRGRILGLLFMFSNAVLDTDPLTGFHNWENFKILLMENKNLPRKDMVVVACDIIGLSFLNTSRGRHVGDMGLKKLADLVRSHFPRDSFFIRGQDATFIIIQVLGNEKNAVENMERIKEQFEFTIQYSLKTSPAAENLQEGIEDVIKGLNQKKLLNKESSHSMVLNSLVQALQECDSDTEAHVQRTQRLGCLLGERIGLNDVQQSDLSLLCLLHDIGKIGVPLEILNKPGKLTSEEWRVLHSHSVKGFQIANSSSELCGIANMILHHHERWDGEGYPDGLSRESIPLLSRVIAVVDAYDAMVNDRSYRTALPQDMALSELKRCAGTQFDPGIVSEFIQMVRSMPKPPKKKSKKLEKVKALVREELTQGIENVSFHAVHNLAFSRYIVDEKFNILSVDAAFEELTGYTQKDIINNRMNHLDLIPENDRTEYLKLVLDVTSKKPQAFFEHRLMRKDGTVVYVFCLGRQYFDSVARAGRSEIIVTDASNTYSLRVIADVERNKAKNREQEWENTFRRDPLTGVLTRAAFKNDTEFKLLEGKSKVMLLMVDVDHFKVYNDTYGHVAGDEFLTLVGQTLLSSLRQDDIAGRMGGDEFAAALFYKKGCSNEFMYERAQQIFDKINMTLSMNEKTTSLSMGAVIADEKVHSFTELYAQADTRLYKSKERGRSRLSVS